MEQNLTALRQAAVIFPVIAVLFTLPYIAYNYRKYGSVISLRIVIVYSFMLYMLCVYCLVILPLPTGEAAAGLHGRRMQLIPFQFVRSMMEEVDAVGADPRTWLGLIGHPAFLSALLNVCMTMPFGVYLRYYFRCGLKRTATLTFLLSLFFELTQLTGLYFIYPGSYRVFDVDDLMTNTLGGLLGYWIARPLTCWLPDRESLDSASLARGRHVSLLRRLMAMGYDLAVSACLCGVLVFFVPFQYAVWGIPAYFCLCPTLLGGRTVGHLLTRTRLERMNGEKPRWYQYPIRYGSLFLLLVGLPLWLNVWIIRQDDRLSVMTLLICLGILNGGYLFCLLFEVIRMAMHRPLFYERLSGTQMASAVPDGGYEDHSGDGNGEGKMRGESGCNSDQ